MTCGAVPGLLALDTAIEYIARNINAVAATREVALAAACGCVTAVDINAPYGLPPFDNTGVDGFALRHADAMSQPLKPIGAAFAGEPFTGEMPAGTAVQIATGAVLPLGADTVVMQEFCRVENGQLTIDVLPACGANIRRAGNDIQAGTLAVPMGQRLAPQQIALLGALGITTVTVRRALRIGIVATGNELHKANTPLAVGHIIDTNSLMLQQLLARQPAAVTMLGALPDDRAATDMFLTQAARDYDLIISTGGVSVGARDYIRDALHALGHIHFWQLALRPGRPVLLGQIGTCLMLGLPGNPVSALVTFFLIAQPVLQALLGITPALPPGFWVPLAQTFYKEKHLRSFPRAQLLQAQGQYQALPYPDQSSNLLTSLARSDGLLDLPLDITEIPAATPVLFRPYHGILA